MESKENFWMLDSSNDFAHWFVQCNLLNHNTLCSEFGKLIDELFKFGKATELLKTDYVFNSFIIDKILSERQLGMRSIDSMIPELEIINNIDAYKNEKISCLDFNEKNVMTLLKKIQHYQSDDYSLSEAVPVRISLDVSEENHSFRLGIHLQSDVFFPYVVCPWKWEERYDDNDEIGPGINELDYGVHGFDNRDLALLNGGRLNELIGQLKLYVNQRDHLTWDYYPTENWLGYHKMVSELGVVL